MRIIARLNIGGPAIHTILLTEGMDTKRFDSTLVTGEIGPKEGDMKYLAEQKGVSPVYIPGLQREISWANDILCLKRVYRLMKDIGPQIIHTHTAKAGTLGRLAAILLTILSPGMGLKKRKPFLLIHTFHGHIFHSYFGPVKTRIFLWLERFLARFTDRIVVISESQKYELAECYRIAPAHKFRVIPLGFDLSPFFSLDRTSGAFRKELGLSKEAVLVSIIGRLVPIKNHRMFLESAVQVKKAARNTEVKFIIVGDGEKRDELRELRDQMGLVDDVLFVGWKTDLRPVYADSDIIALTSLNEGTPVAIVEAMASGRPVVATDVGGVADLLVSDHNVKTANPSATDGRAKIRSLLYDVGQGFYAAERGVIARPGDVDGFAGGILHLVKNPALRRELGRKGTVFCKRKYSKERLVGDIENLYEEAYKGLIEDKGGASLPGGSPSAAVNGNQALTNALTIDLEDWYQGLELENERGIENRVEKNTLKILSLLDECKTQATFFVLGRVAEAFPEIVREVIKRGHELGSHGYRHRPIYLMSKDEFRRDLRASLDAIEKAVGVRVANYRAPFFSITEKSLWAYPILVQEGIRNDSSVFPIRYYRYGIESSPVYPFSFHLREGQEITEFPISTVKFLGYNIPFSGGGYFRLLPFWMVRKGLLKQIELGRPAVFYFHPWEIDPDQPRMRGLPRRIRIPHYINLDKTEERLRTLLKEFRFSTLSHAIGHIAFS